MRMCASWMRGVSVEGTSSRMSLKEAILPPPAPVNPMVRTPFALADSKAMMMLAEFPEVDNPTNTSPSSQTPSTILEYTYS